MPPRSHEQEAPRAPLRIVQCRTLRAVDLFAEAVYRIRAGEPHWVPPPRAEQRELLDRDKHPFHEHAEVAYFLALRGGRPVGRISACENYAHNVAHDEKIGFFGFLDVEDDPEAFGKLLRAAEHWARRRGLTALRGPASFSTNEECGLLIEGHHLDPVVMMDHHPRYYQKHIETLGYQKAEDLLCYWVENNSYSDRFDRLADGSRKRLERGGHEITFRPLDMRRFAEEVELVKTIYNGAWEQNWGFVPLTEREVEHMAKKLKPIVVAELVRFAFIDGKPAGLVLSLPDYNQLLKLFDGRMGLVEIGAFLALRKRIRTLRVLMLGIMPDFRKMGLELLLLQDWTRAAQGLGFCGGDMSWLLERNRLIIDFLKTIGGVEYKRYRLYEKPLSC